MMFAAITPLLMTGSFAERAKWKAFFVLTVFWELLVYYPVAHWVWGGGWLEQLGALDFAGGIVIHTTAGTGALVIALFMGRRRDFDKYDALVLVTKINFFIKVSRRIPTIQSSFGSFGCYFVVDGVVWFQCG